MKKIISIILTVVLCASFCVVPVFAEYSPAENFALALNMTDKEGYVPGKTITRAEFAEIIANICNLMDANRNFKLWQEYVYGSDNNNTVITDGAEMIFDDVDSSLPQYDAIMKVYKFGYMNGMTESHFGPNYDITMGEVLKVVVSMLGYEEMAKIKGGYPNGYIQAANTIKLTSGMKFAPSDYATYEMTAQLIYNALDIPVYEIGAIGDDYIDYVKSDETFLKARLGLERAEGIMTDNGISSIYGSSKAGEDAVIVNGVSVFVEKCGYARDFLGRNVEVYYMEDGGKNHLVYACVSQYDKAITINAKDFVSLRNGEFTYFDGKGKTETEKASKAKLVYNGAALGTWQTSLLENIKFGDITIVSTEGNSTYDLIIANDYMVGKVAKKDNATRKVYAEDLFSGMSAVKTLDLSDTNDAMVSVVDAKGNPLTFDDIETDDIVSVLKSRNNEALKVVVSKAKQTDFVLVDYSQSDEFEMIGENQSFVIENYENIKDAERLTVGVSYTIYFDFMGNAVWYSSSASAAPSRKGILMDVDNGGSGFTDEYYIRIYSARGKIEDYTLEERVTINGSRYDADEAMDIIADNVTDAILFGTNEEETKIKAIVTPLGFGEPDSDNRGWYRVLPKMPTTEAEVEEYCNSEGGHSGTFCKTWADYTSNHGYDYSEHGAKIFGKRFAYVNSSVVFKIPNDSKSYSDEKFFSVNLHAFLGDNKKNQINGYATDRLSLAPEVLVVASDATGGAKAAKEYTRFLISKVFNTVDDEGDNVVGLKGIYFDHASRSAKETTFYMNEDTVFLGSGTAPTALPNGYRPPDEENDGVYKFDKSGPAELSAGDIIGFSLTGDTLISSIRLCYDYSTGFRYSCGSNNNDSVSLLDTAVGYPAYVKDGLVKLAINGTDPSLCEDPDYTFDLSKFRTQKLATNCIFVVEATPSGVSVKKASVDEIISYKDSGALPSKLALLSHYGDLNYGTVIYR